MSAKDKMLELLKKNVTKIVTRDELSSAADVHDWQRSLRSLREEGWKIESKKEGYILHSITQETNSKERKSINNKTRYAVLQRDNSTCQRCGNVIKDGITLEVDHKVPVNWGGNNDLDNLWTLCSMCNGGKKNLFSDADADAMKEVIKETNGYKKLKKLFELCPNQMFEPNLLSAISGIRDWTRTIRLVREKEKMNIYWFPPDEDHPDGGYVNKIG